MLCQINYYHTILKPKLRRTKALKLLLKSQMYLLFNLPDTDTDTDTENSLFRHNWYFTLKLLCTTHRLKKY